MQFIVNKSSSVPIHVQLKEQIQYQIASGAFANGAGMPSINDLASSLGIHRNTAHRVYLELQTAGLLVSRPGKGMFVSPNASRSHIDFERSEAFLQQIFEKAQEEGIHPVWLTRMANQRVGQFDRLHPTFAFVECTRHDALVFAHEIEESWQVSVPHILLEDLVTKTRSIPSSVSTVITSFFHIQEVRDLVGPEGPAVESVTYDLDPRSLDQVLALEAKSRVGLLCHDANTEEILLHMVSNSAPRTIEILSANVEERERALEVLEQVESLCFTSAATVFVLENSSTSHELIEIHFALNRVSLDGLRTKLLPVF